MKTSREAGPGGARPFPGADEVVVEDEHPLSVRRLLQRRGRRATGHGDQALGRYPGDRPCRCLWQASRRARRARSAGRRPVSPATSARSGPAAGTCRRRPRAEHAMSRTLWLAVRHLVLAEQVAGTNDGARFSRVPRPAQVNLDAECRKKSWPQTLNIPSRGHCLTDQAAAGGIVWTFPHNPLPPPWESS